jgi:hypothetical protein
MNPELLLILQDQFLNKKITVPIPERDNSGKTIPNKFQQCTGICSYIGPNNTLNWDIQVTVDGTPIQVKHINDIKLFVEPSPIRKQ